MKLGQWTRRSEITEDLACGLGFEPKDTKEIQRFSSIWDSQTVVSKLSCVSVSPKSLIFSSHPGLLNKNFRAWGSESAFF